ncbi:hypothetical protein ACJIZ3_022403 [Penstemon smallii]|uniref:Uncharacterized protein n=1 Tax=Penstemon smallii TaxID=265156 RepID=A0ABD3TL35_9LAMI
MEQNIMADSAPRSIVYHRGSMSSSVYTPPDEQLRGSYPNWVVHQLEQDRDYYYELSQNLNANALESEQKIKELEQEVRDLHSEYERLCAVEDQNRSRYRELKRKLRELINDLSGSSTGVEEQRILRNRLRELANEFEVLGMEIALVSSL